MPSKDERDKELAEAAAPITTGPLAPPEPEFATAPTVEEAAAAAAAGDEASEDAETVKAKRGHVFATYAGHAHAASYNDPDSGQKIKFEPGVPVLVTKAIAEELATHPFEDWTFADEVDVPAEQEE